MRLRRSLVHSALGTTTVRVFGTLSGVMLARLLGPEGRGELAVLVVVATMAGTALLLGLPFWIIRTIAQSGPLVPIERPLWIHVQFCTGILVAGVAAVVLSNVTTANGLATLALVATWICSGLALALPNGARAMGTVAVCLGTGSAVYIALLAILLVTENRSIPAVLLATAAGQATTAVLAIWWWIQHRNGELHAHLSYITAVVSSVPAALGELTTYAATRIDVVLVAALLDTRSAGLYAVALTVAEAPTVVADAVAQVTTPYIAEATSVRTAGDLARSVLVLGALIGTLVAVMSWWVIPLVFGSEFQASARLVPVLVVGGIALGMWKVANADLAARDQNQYRAYSALAGLAALVTADLALIPTLGLTGAAVGSSFGYGTAFVASALMWSRVTGSPVSDLLVPRRVDFLVVSRLIAGGRR